MKPLYKEKYPHLFQPLIVGKNQVVFNNRVMLAPMGCIPSGGGADADGRINVWGVEAYIEWAKGGFSSVCLPMEIPVNASHDNMFNALGPMNYMNFHLLQRAVHAYNTKTFVETGHCGAQVQRPDLPPLGADSYMYNGRQVRGMDYNDMENVIKDHVDLLKLVARSNFDGVLLHYGHGCLGNQFLSPLTNHRKDEFGGSVENRCRFPLMIIKAIREAVGDNLLIELRLNGWDGLDGGITPEDAAEQALIFQDYVDMIHFTCGTRIDASSRPKMHPSNFTPFAHNAFAAEVVKKKGVKIPIGIVGAVHNGDVAEEVLAKGQADYVVMGRAAVADSQLVRKLKEGRPEDVRPCLRCNYCMDHGRRNPLSLELRMAEETTFDRRCSVNPLYAQGITKNKITPTGVKKQVIVIGGGVAGMQAALSAADRGHSVTLFEKTDKLGGQALLSDVMWFKREMKMFHEYLERQVRKNPQITIVMNTQATREMIDEADPDAVIVAVGAKQIVPKIPGVENAVMAFDVFGHEDRLGKKVVIVGGGSIGCELAIHLSAFDRQCTIVEMGEYLAATSQLTERMSYFEHLDKNHVVSYLNTKCVEIAPNGVQVADKENNFFIEADTVIVCVGTQALVEERNKFIDSAYDVINVGDCLKASNIVHAVETAYDAGLIL